MPIYEYQAIDPEKGCRRCRGVFEMLQNISERPLRRCPACGTQIKKRISRCRALVTETPEPEKHTVKKIRAYEKAGLWSHAAELADTHAEKTKDNDLKARALEDYRKAGHEVDRLTPAPPFPK